MFNVVIYIDLNSMIIHNIAMVAEYVQISGPVFLIIFYLCYHLPNTYHLLVVELILIVIHYLLYILHLIINSLRIY